MSDPTIDDAPRDDWDLDYVPPTPISPTTGRPTPSPTPPIPPSTKTTEPPSEPTPHQKDRSMTTYRPEDLARWELAVIIAGIIGLIVAVVLSWPALVHVQPF